MIEAILFDLDDTLVVEQPAADEAFRAACILAQQRYEIDPEVLHRTVRLHARELWFAAPTHPYCRRIGMSSWEGLWARFDGDDPNLEKLRAWAPTYRRSAWVAALRRHGVRDRTLADELAERFIRERRSRHALFPETEHALQQLCGAYRLALITNGVPDLQKEKIQATDLRRFFESIVLSGDVGVGKPDPRIFSVALENLSASPEEAVMVGDSLHRDIAGARGVGMRGIWVNRARAAADIDITPEGEVAALTGIEDTLQEIE